MDFTDTRSFRSINCIVNSCLISSSFLGGPSSKTMISMTGGGTIIQPEYSMNHPQTSIGLTGSEYWKIERVVALTMLAIIPISFIFSSMFMNYLLAVSLAIHAHWGMDAVLIDYCPRKALPLANIIRYILTTIAFAGLCYFNYNNMGLIKALKALWTMY
ncbi:unnamed protein product [Rotaria sp. Silwood1]|nr:unnamed protein product [Rotaria sp. Silwood1]CAF3582961.1 unnamed protein product [Rotaria sp. Silwood1]CAF3604317.1 unnamed protein product [Rotaria sp. Silwood1]CAF4809079.1 unnamed protein product [Rotaria sp. Silwood1]CAF4899759.1 unnamed protein product [Rotaria sp. Silwood1]